MSNPWWRVFLYGFFLMWPAKILAPIAVLFVDDDHPVWGNDERIVGYWDSAFRNGAFNFLRRPLQPYIQTGSYLTRADDSMERFAGFQWRKRITIDGKYVSFRATWGKPHASKGKKEFYIGWTMDYQREDMGLTFFQFTPLRGVFSRG